MAAMETTTRYSTRVETLVGDTVVRIAVYARLSKNRNGLSTNTAIQVAECLEEIKYYAAARGVKVEIVVVFEENDVSASRYSKKPRPDFQSLIELIKQNKVDVVFATEMERLVRRPREMEDIIDLAESTDLREIYLTADEGFNLTTIKGIGDARAAAWAGERESRKISERTRRKQADRARSGQTHGGRRCFGYKPGNMELDETEAAILREMGAKVLGGYSFKDIAYWANEQGYRTAEGKLWYPVTIRNTLRRVRYAGIREHNGAEYPAQWPAVFDEVTWEKLQLTIKVSADRFADRRKARRYLLTGRLFCGSCGGRLNGEHKRDHSSRPLRPIYRCRPVGDAQREGGCGGVSINATALDWYIREQVFAALDTEKLAELLKEGEPNDDKLRQLLEQKATQKLRADALVDDYASGLLTRDELSRAKTKAQAELSRLDNEIELLNARRRRTGLIPVVESIREAWDANVTNGWRGEVIDMVIERIDVDPGLGKPYVEIDGIKMRFDQSRVRVTWRTFDELEVAARLSLMLQPTLGIAVNRGLNQRQVALAA